MIEHDKFTYFPLGKAFEKQTKKVDEQGEKQIKAIKKHGKQSIKSSKFDKGVILPPDKKKKFYKLVEERIGKIEKLHNSIDP